MAGAKVSAAMMARASPWSADLARALKRRGHSPQTVAGYVTHALGLEKFLASKGILRAPDAKGSAPPGARTLDGWAFDAGLVNYDTLLGYLDTLEGLSPRTVSARFTSIGKYLRHLEWHHEFPRVDMERFWEEELRAFTKQIKRLRARRINTPPTLAELQYTLALEPNLRNRAFLLLAAKTGARRGELLSLDWSDLDLDAGLVHFKDNGQHFKRTTFAGFIDQETVIALRLWHAAWKETRAPGEAAVFVTQSGRTTGKRMGRQGALTLVSSAFGRLGLSYNVHSLRHWFSDTLRARGMPDHMISYLRGDAPQLTLDLYTHLQSEAGRASLRAAYDAAMPNLALPPHEVVAAFRAAATERGGTGEDVRETAL